MILPKSTLAIALAIMVAWLAPETCLGYQSETPAATTSGNPLRFSQPNWTANERSPATSRTKPSNSTIPYTKVDGQALAKSFPVENPQKPGAFATNKDTKTNLQNGRASYTPLNSSGSEPGLPTGIQEAIYPANRSANAQSNVSGTSDKLAQGHGTPSIRNSQIQKASHAAPLEPSRVSEPPGFSRLPKPIENPSSPAQASQQGKTLAMLMQSSTAMNFAPEDSNDVNMTESDLQNIFQKPEAKPKTRAPEQFQQTLQRIATSTCLVLIFGVAFILVAKRFVGGSGSTRTTQALNQQIKIVNSLRLNPKSNLHLVEVASHRVLVACDLNGIKSVVSLSTSFEDTLQNYHEDSPESQDGAAETTEKKSTQAIEAEMQEKLSQLLGGEAFKDVFYRDRAIA